MTKLANVDFDESVLDALRDDKLVIFAGAGVSMGAPSNLASFWTLAKDIAQGTGQTPTEPLDRFLGQLQHRNVPVHERAAHLLSPPNSTPNTLHENLLRLFGAKERVKLVTTNFDLHFETAASALFGSDPDTYQAPALPLGYNFTGIVHVHGALPRPQSLVLTDADFGRAYLTEGWARRFLVDLFREYTVLFIGYSHDDVVMSYLARALPADGISGRFAITDKDGHWDFLGIKPIRFNRGTGSDEYRDLYEGIQKLADRASRDALDWQTRLIEIGSREPPADEEAIGEIEQALRQIHTTRFLTNVARDAQWPLWMSARKHLDALFSPVELSERDMLLATWLARHFVVDHPDEIFNLFTTHGLKLNPQFWWLIGCELGRMEESTLKRWASILLSTAPPNVNVHTLSQLAEQCASQGLILLTLKVFLFMGEHRLNLKPAFIWRDDQKDDSRHCLDTECLLRSDQWDLGGIWVNHLEPNIAQVAQPLLFGTTRCLENMHHDLAAWDKASRDWDLVSYSRSAIEPHAQDRNLKAVDVLIDAARDSLEWLAVNRPALAEAWIESLVTSDVPLLRRLAIHVAATHPDKSADDRMKWLLDRVGLHDFLATHEIHRAAALNYPHASDNVRQKIVDEVLAHALPASEFATAEQRTTNLHADWLSWLLRSKPDCLLAQASLAPITAQNLEWRPSDHPDFIRWMSSGGWVNPQSPWSIEELLAREPFEQLADLLGFQGSYYNGPSRDGLNSAIQGACKKNSDWAFALAGVLIDQLQFQSDLWPELLRGIQDSELTVDGWRNLLAIVSRPEIYTNHLLDIANLLHGIVQNGGKPFSLDLLDKANALSLEVWHVTEPDAPNGNINQWLTQGINETARIIVEFWIGGLSLLLSGKTGTERSLPENYQHWFTMVLQDKSSNGDLGRVVLASQTAFLFSLDEAWTRLHVIPLFSDDDRNKFAHAWSGFLSLGRLYPALTETLIPAFIEAISRIDTDLPANQRRWFIEFYTVLAVFHLSDPTTDLIPKLFQYCSLEDRAIFASHIGYYLRQMESSAKQQLWNAWLERYWQNRLNSIPAALDQVEIREMLAWLTHLEHLFPIAVPLLTRSPFIGLEYSAALNELRNSDLVTRYPAETAELLIYFCNCNVGYTYPDLGVIAGRLPVLEPGLQRRLNERLAFAGARLQS